jgi:TonB-linked SusC/RagA family outer membrane protein
MRKITMMLTFLLFAGLNFAFAQTRTISGIVTSAEDGSALPGVTVQVKGTTVGTTTDLDGKYVLKIQPNQNILVFSFVGMKTREVAINGKTKINVVLSPEVKGLNEVVVMGYTTKGKNEITGSTVQVQGTDINEVPVASVDQALQGKVPGLSISASSGTPGSVQDIRIRGVGSITAGNDPLIVIDGVPVINSNFSGSSARSSLSALAALNSDDIASITVLKDASATSAYGARGSNGVIVITTKKGKTNAKTTFNLSSSIGYQNNAVEGEVPLTGDQRKTLLLEAVYNSYGEAYGFTRDEALDFLTANLYDGGLSAWNGKDGNWGNEVANKNAPLRSVNLSATGGDKLSSFYVSLGYDKTEATVIGSDFKRVSATLNFNRKMAKNIQFSTNNIVSNTFQNSFLEQSAYFANPFLTKYFMSPWEQPYNDDGTLNTNLNTSLFNTLYLAKNNISTNDLTRALSNSYVTWEIIKNLKFKSLVSLDYTIAN